MSGIELRDYQREVIARLNAEVVSGRRRILLVAPTGSGKTVLASALIAEAVQRKQRALFLAHRRELINQASRKLHAAGVDAGIILPGYPMRLAEPVQVASIASLRARAISSSIDMPIADIVVVDEAHHARARTYRRILQEYPEAVVVGMTATPCRGDGRGLGNIFEVLVECPDVDELTEAGWLVRAEIYAPTTPDLAGIRIRQGDYDEGQLAERMDRPQLVGDIIAHWFRLNPGRRSTIVYGTSVAHSVHLRDEFRRSGVLAEHIDGSTPTEERDSILARLARGEVEAVCNCMVLTEGFDAPDVGCLVLARPTKSLGLFRQMIGRGLRSAPGKTDCIILDHAGVVFTHGLPDDPITWTLHEDRKAENRAQAARGAKGGPPKLTDCPECHAVRFEGRPCTVCGWRPTPKPAFVNVIDGDLGRVERDRSVTVSALDRRRFYAQLLYIAGERGYQRGWAGHKFREKFGAWPSWRFADPIPPDDATRAWVRSRAIAWARAQQKAGAA